MCNLYSITSSQAAIRQLARAMRDVAGNAPALPAVLPDYVAPVVRTAPDGVRELVMMRWGFPPPRYLGSKAPVTNIRNTNSNWWRPWLLAGHRCLVPVNSFAEYDHRTKPPTCTWLALDDKRPLFFFAGIWRPWTGARGTKAAPAIGDHLLFSFLTTEANAVVAPVHPEAMPVVLLTEEDRETWMRGTFGEALTLQKPAANDAVRIVSVGSREDTGRDAHSQHAKRVNP